VIGDRDLRGQIGLVQIDPNGGDFERRRFR
jgi:hypothetical protein